MAAPDPNARSTEGKTYPEKQVDRAHHLIEKCIDQYMDRDETARKLEVQFRINPHLTRIVWDRLEKDNQEFFQNYYIRLALKRLTVKINELLDQPPRAMDFPVVPSEQEMKMELAEKAPQADFPVSITNNENEAESNKLPANPVSFFGSEEVAPSNPNLLPGCSLVRSSLEGEGMKINAALKPISQVPNLMAGGNHTANFRVPAQSWSSLAGTSTHSYSNPEESGFHSRILTAPDPNAQSTEDDDVHNEIDRAKDMIERCLQLYMNRNETAHTLEVHCGIHPGLTRLTWDKLAEDNPEFFQNYYTRLVLIKQINRFNELLEQQHRAMNIHLVPAEQQMSMELAGTAPQADSPLSITNNDNEAQSDPNPVSSVGSEEVVGFDLNLVPGGSLAQSPLEGQGMKTNTALDSALMQISQVLNLSTGGNHTANSRGPAQPSSSMAGSSSHLDSNPEASDQKDLANLASGQGFPSADL